MRERRDVDVLGERVAQPVREPGREDQGPVADRGPGDGFGDDRLDDLLLLAKVLDQAHTWISEQAQAQEVPF